MSTAVVTSTALTRMAEMCRKMDISIPEDHNEENGKGKQREGMLPMRLQLRIQRMLKLEEGREHLETERENARKAMMETRRGKAEAQLALQHAQAEYTIKLANVYRNTAFGTEVIIFSFHVFLRILFFAVLHFDRV